MKDRSYDYTGETGDTAARKAPYVASGAHPLSTGAFYSPTAYRCRCGAEIFTDTNGMGVVMPFNATSRTRHVCDFTTDPFSRRVAQQEEA